MSVRSIVLLVFMSVSCWAVAQDMPPVVIDYFYEAGCPDCQRVKNQVLPDLTERFTGCYVLNRYDVGEKQVIRKLFAYQEKLGITKNEPVCMVVDYNHVLNGFPAIKEGLLEKVDECLAERSLEGWTPPEPIHEAQSASETLDIARRRSKGFTVGMVLVAGLTDGINPCAIASLVFLMSLLRLSRNSGGSRDVSRPASPPQGPENAKGCRECLTTDEHGSTRMGEEEGRGDASSSQGRNQVAVADVGDDKKRAGRGLILVGVSYCVASFVTYIAIGFGLLRALHLLDQFTAIQKGLELCLLVILAILAFLSFRDAYRFKTGGNPDDITLQLPKRVKRTAQKIMREGIKARSLVLGGISIGVLVTGIETVCTGQVLVPTLIVVIRESGKSLRELSYLLLYNFMFILPLIVVFALTYYGLTTERLLEWSKKNVVFSKVLLGCFFIAMAILLLVL